ncbi:MAG: magnesium transporter, partial [bacterium]
MDEKSLIDVRRQIEELVESGEVDELQELLSRLHPSDIAFLFPKLDRLEQNFVWDLLPEDTHSDVLVELDETSQEKLLDTLSEGEIGRIVDDLESDDAADVIAALDEEKAQKVLETLDLESRREVRRLLDYDEDTAGGIMALEVVAVQETDSVQQAIQKIRDLHETEGIEDIYTVYVISQDGVLKGFVQLRQLVLNRADMSIREIMDPDVISVPVHLDQEEVAVMVRKYDLVSVPVVDEFNRLIGRITVDDIVDVIAEEAEEDLSIIAGTGEEEPGERSTFKVSRERLPWLLVGLGGGLVSATVLHHFQATLLQVIALAFFVPVITAMGGNTAIQSASIVVRGLATGEIDWRDFFVRIWKEFRIALLNGLILGLVICSVVALWLKDTQLSLLIGLILLVNISIATLIGTAVPLIMKR